MRENPHKRLPPIERKPDGFLYHMTSAQRKQARAIEATLNGITPFNAGKKKEEALSLLKNRFPQMENFSGKLKKYKVTINDLLVENEKLEEQAKASESGKMKRPHGTGKARKRAEEHSTAGRPYPAGSAGRAETPAATHKGTVTDDRKHFAPQHGGNVP